MRTKRKQKEYQNNNHALPNKNRQIKSKFFRNFTIFIACFQREHVYYHVGADFIIVLNDKKKEMRKEAIKCARSSLYSFIFHLVIQTIRAHLLTYDSQEKQVFFFCIHLFRQLYRVNFICD